MSTQLDCNSDLTASLPAEEPTFFSPVNASGERTFVDANVYVLNNNSPESQGSQVSSNASHRPVPISSRKASKKNNKGKPRIVKGKFVRVKRKDLYHLLTETQRAVLPRMGPTISGDYPCIGKVVGGSSNGGWIIAFDDLPEAEKKVTVNRNKVALLEEGEYEVQHPPQLQDMVDDDGDDEEEDLTDNDDERNKRKRKKKKLSPDKESIKNFCALDDNSVKKITAFEYKWGRQGCSNQVIKWKVHGKTEYITQSPLQIPTQGPAMISNHVDFSLPPITNFFKHVFPDLTGHGKIMDTYLLNPRASHHSTYLQLGHQFHDDESVDPDWLVKQCYTLLIAAVTEIERGVQNLWKSGELGGRHRNRTKIRVQH
jgi:hypothetical protein